MYCGLNLSVSETILTLRLLIVTKYRLLIIYIVHLNVSVANSVDSDQTAPKGAVWSESTIFACMQKLVLDVTIYMQEATSADNIFRSIFS